MWGLNGAFGVLGGMVAILISMSLGIRACLLVGAACYLLLSFSARALWAGDGAGDGTESGSAA